MDTHPAAFLLTFRAALAFGVACLTSVFAAAADGDQPTFTQPDVAVYRTDDGTVTLAWAEEPSELDRERIYEVRRWRAGGPDEGMLVYEGSDTATFLSGLPEGSYQVRIRARSPETDYPVWGEEYLSVEVEYIERWLVTLLMSVGFLTFLAIVGSIVLGHRNSLRERAMNR